MSGPKVVRIVTREEIIAICEQHLARLEAAVARWTASGRRSDTITEVEIAEVQQRRDQFRALLAADAFVELQKAAPEEIAFLDRDMQSRLARAVERAAAERTRRRRRASAAQTVLAELRASSKPVPSNLKASLEAILSGATADQDAEGVFAKAFALLGGNGPAATVPDRARDIAMRLGAGERPTSLAEWRTNICDKESDERLVRVDGLIAELQVNDEDAGAAFVRRLVQINAEPAATHTSLLIDSLIADLAEATRKAREQSDLRAQLSAQLAEIKRFSSAPAQALAADMEAALAASDTSCADRLLAAAAAQVKVEINRIAAEARRQAILQGLSSLGYEVREGMATAFANGEAVVMQHAMTPGFGLEVSGPPEAQQLQMRVVAFRSPGAPRDSSRDRDIELQWCGDFSKLQSALGDIGGEIAIERSLAVGAVPLKEVLAEKAFSTASQRLLPRFRAHDKPRD